MRSKIKDVRAMEILDSRGNPTVKAFVTLSNGIIASASCPSGASTGEHEAVELRDGGASRYGAKRVLKAVAHVNEKIAPILIDMDPARQAEIDRLMIHLDGTPNKQRLGANAIVSVSMAVARAAAVDAGLPLYAYMGGFAAVRIPMPMIMPVGAPNFTEAMLYATHTFHALKDILSEKKYTTSVGDEGGFAPNLKSNDEACELIIQAIETAGLKPGKDVAIALDPAASSFYGDGGYEFKKSGQGKKSAADMIALYRDWIGKYPIVSIEDGLAENDWEGFCSQTAEQGNKIQIVGDDIFVTNTRYIARGIKEKAANAVLIKLNQIGTVTETMEAINLCRKAGWGFVVSHRSGETDDSFIADFAVAMGGGQIKTGSVCRGERVAKYNRLLEIEAELGKAAIFENPFKGAS
ncbi:MAG: phosphopyruvate hydratase [Deltaproteobacteria bacterium]|nr:phosphopyruvate hydratase [Deltaproteobacteria bacterium]